MKSAVPEIRTILGELTALFDKLDPAAVDRAAECILRHDRVFFHAAGRSGLMLRALAMRLAQMGRCAYVVGETVTPAIAEGDLLFVASASGKTHSVCHCVEIAAQTGADLFVVTAAAESPLTAIHPADALLPAASKDHASGSSQTMGSLFEQALLLLCDAVVLHLPADSSAMRQRHANLE